MADLREVIRFSRIATNGIHLHVAGAGPSDGPLVVLLHGFPEFWYGWRNQIAPLAERGFHVVAPDKRGYNLSDKPKGVGAYDLDQLAADVVGLADHSVGFPPGAKLNGEEPDTSGPRVFQAVKQQLGLELKADKGPVDVIVIDSAERPAGN